MSMEVAMPPETACLSKTVTWNLSGCLLSAYAADMPDAPAPTMQTRLGFGAEEWDGEDMDVQEMVVDGERGTRADRPWVYARRAGWECMSSATATRGPIRCPSSSSSIPPRRRPRHGHVAARATRKTLSETDRISFSSVQIYCAFC